MTISIPGLEGTRVAVIGAGALGTALGRALRQTGLEVAAVVSRRLKPAQGLAEEVGAGVASIDVDDIPEDVDVVLCCVPDNALSELAAELAGLRRRWDGVLVAHTSGALTADVLAPLEARGAKVLSFHPMQTFPPGSSPGAFRGIYVGLEGDPDAVVAGARIAAILGAHSVEIPSDAKRRYHLAGSIVSNFMVTLAAMAQEVLDSAGITGEAARGLLSPLMASTVQNLASHSPEEALTGPIVRGDLDTVSAHLAALDRYAPHLRPMYQALGLETVRLARRSGRLGDECAGALIRILTEGAPEDYLSGRTL